MQKKSFTVLSTVVIMLLTTQVVFTKKIIEKDLSLNVIENSSLSFTENQGQWDNEVQFRVDAGGATMWFASDGAYYQFTRNSEMPETNSNSVFDDFPEEIIDEIKSSQTTQLQSMMIKANYIGANLNSQIAGVGLKDYKCNYFIGNDKSKWATDVPNYSAIMYQEVYDGIDLKYYGNGSQMEYDFIVSPGADYSQIEISYEGVESIAINESGELVVTTMWGDVVEQRPVIYQLVSNKRISIEGVYKVQSEKSFTFEVNGYDSKLPLVIDPVLSFSTYVGEANSAVVGGDIVIDETGATYITGATSTTDFPTFNPYQEDQNNYDVYITKLNSSGDDLVYSTYLGGSDHEWGKSIAIDATGATYITGHTISADFPTLNSYQEDQFNYDVFVTKLSPSGNSLVYSTYLGGTEHEFSNDIAVDDSGFASIIGHTSSTDFPLLNQHQSFLSGEYDAFVTKLNQNGDNIVFSSYMGGTNRDEGHSIAIDISGAVYVTGNTKSDDFPLLNPYQSTFNSHPTLVFTEAFVSKFSSQGNLIYSTYLGGSLNESYICEGAIAVDDAGSAYILGRTSSYDFPTQNPYQATPKVGYNGMDLFVTKLSSSGDSLVYSTYLGGSAQRDFGFDIVVDDFGSAYITGATESTDFPMLSPNQGTHQGGWDVFVTKFSPSGNSLVYSTFFGGSGNDFAVGIAVDSIGAVYIAGTTGSNDIPLINNYQDTDPNFSDVFVFKFNPVSTCCLGITGNVNSDIGDNIDISDLISLFGYMFQDGDDPRCMDEANIDGTAGIDISDLILLIGYMFQGGEDPAICP